MKKLAKYLEEFSRYPPSGVVVILLTLIIAFIVHETGHIIFQKIFGIPIEFDIGLFKFSTTKNLVSMVPYLPKYQVLWVYASGFLVSLIPLLSRKFKEKLINLSKSLKKHPFWFYFFYLVFCILIAFKDFKSLWYQL